MASPTQPTWNNSNQPTDPVAKSHLTTCPDFEVLTSRPGKLHEGFGNVEPIQLGGFNYPGWNESSSVPSKEGLG